MAKTSKHTIVLDMGDCRRKLCKVMFGSDGSYYVTVPYHEAKQAILFKASTNYDSGQSYVSLNEALDVASLDEGRLKLSHHPDGFVQYSGDGVLSGRDAEGRIKGVGVFSSPLSEVGSGPAFTMAMTGLEKFDLADAPGKDDVVFNLADLGPLPGAHGISLEGHYFQPSARRFLRRDSEGKWFMEVPHPCGHIVRMRVVFSGDDCDYPGFMGLEMYRYISERDWSGFTLNGPGESIRRNAAGERIGDLLFCMYPRKEDMPVRRSADFKSVRVDEDHLQQGADAALPEASIASTGKPA